MRKTRLIAAAVATAAFAAAAAPAGAVTVGGQTVAGTTTGNLALGVPTVAAALTNFTPGGGGASTAVSSPFVVTATGNWKLFVGDGTGNGGHLAAAALGCPGSEAQTVHQLVATTSGGTSVTHDGPVTVGPLGSGVGTQIAHGSLANTVLVDYSLAIDATEQMLTGCVYSTDTTWTVQ